MYNTQYPQFRQSPQGMPYMATNQPQPQPQMQQQPQQTKSSKGWMICSIVLFLVIIGLSVFMVVNASNDTSSDPKEVANLKQQLSNRDAEIAKLKEEKKTEMSRVDTPEITDPSLIDPKSFVFDIASLKSKVGDQSIIKLEFTKDGKYLYAITYGDGAGTAYKELGKDNPEWTILNNGQNIGKCDTFTDEQKEFMKKYKYIDDDLDSRYLGCEDENGEGFPE